MPNTEHALFTEKKWKEIVNLVSDLNASQSLWLSNHLSNLAVSQNPKIESQTKSQRIVVAYGTETGNSKGIAQQFASLAADNNKTVEVNNLADLKTRQLANIDMLFIICSTHGDGDPPESIETFYHALLNHQSSLNKLAFSVLALGDSTYDLFCETGRIIDKQLTKLNAQQLLICTECDVDFEEQAKEWITQCLSFVPEKIETETNFTPAISNVDSIAFSKRNPLQVEVLENIALTAPSRINPIHHLELALNPDLSLKLKPGDSIGIFPHNPLWLIQRVLALGNFSENETVTVKEQTMSLVDALREHVDLTVVSSKFITSWATLSKNKDLLLLIEDKDKTKTFLKGHHLTDILKCYPANIEAQQFLSLLRPLQPRLYDVANSQRVVDTEIHLTVELHLYDFAGEAVNGIGSEYLLNLQEGETLTIFPQHNKRFQLPTNPNVPIIMIATGTGIAPYRAFSQEITNNNERQHPTWLVLAEQTFTDDFLYQMEWLQATESGALTKLDTLFHVDTPSVSLLDVLTDSFDTFNGWIEAGAHVYFSGHKHELNQLEKSLQSVFDADEDTNRTWAELSSENRLHRNLY